MSIDRFTDNLRSIEERSIRDVFRALGFTPYGTGGGCTAYRCELPGGQHALVTDMNLSTPGTWLDEADLGIYEDDDGGEPVSYASFRTVGELTGRLRCAIDNADDIHQGICDAANEDAEV